MALSRDANCALHRHFAIDFQDAEELGFGAFAVDVSVLPLPLLMNLRNRVPNGDKEYVRIGGVVGTVGTLEFSRTRPMPASLDKLLKTSASYLIMCV